MTVATDELTALREGAACCRHGLRFLAGVAGADALDWLERLCSNPVKTIAAGGVVAATLMDGKGRLRADLRVLAPGDPAAGLLLDLPASHREALLRLLDMYVIKDDVQLSDRSQDHELLSLLGPTSDAVLSRAGLERPASGRLARCDAVLVLESRLGGVAGYDLVAPARQVAALQQRLAAAGATDAGLQALDVVRLQHGVPWFGCDLAEGVIPLEALLDEEVSITKGCYPGQEVVARIRNLGQVARKLVRLVGRGDSAPAPGELQGTGEHEGKPAGLLTSAAADPASGTIWALGFVRRAHWRSGTLLRAGGTELTVESLAGD